MLGHYAVGGLFAEGVKGCEGFLSIGLGWSFRVGSYGWDSMGEARNTLTNLRSPKLDPKMIGCN